MGVEWLWYLRIRVEWIFSSRPDVVARVVVLRVRRIETDGEAKRLAKMGA